MRATLVLALVLLGVGCGVPDGGVNLRIPGRAGTEPLHAPLELSVRVSAKADEVVVLRGQQELARGAPQAKAVLRFAVDGRPLVLELRGVSVEPECSDRAKPGARKPEVMCKDLTWIAARLSSPAGPLPGTTPSLPGAERRRFLLLALPGLLAGLLVGWVAQRKLGLGLLLGLAALGGAVVVGRAAGGGGFWLTYALAFLANATAGLLGAVIWRENSRLAGAALVIGPIAGALPVVFAHRHWTVFGPLIAAGFGALAVIGAALLLLALTGILGARSPASRWLRASAD